MKLRCYFGWIRGSLFLVWLATMNSAIAQIVPDATTPTRITTPDNLNFTIEDGTRAGNNLFHSFREFSIPTGGTAFFNNVGDVQNIFSRVTGNTLSHIDGLIRANGTANLFLINPNGIIFGPNARLNLGGSFLASTASSVKFADGSEFSVTNPQSPLLTISVPVGLQLGNSAGSILVQGLGHNVTVNFDTGAFIRGEIPQSLQVQTGKTLALVGNGITLDSGNLIAGEGRLELGSIAVNSLVNLIAIQKGYALGYEGVQTFQDIQLLNRASSDTSGEGGGEFQIRGRNLILTEGSAILGLTQGATLGGTLSVNTTESVQVIGVAADGFPSSLFTDTEATGAGGDITIVTGQLMVRDGAAITTSSVGEGLGGTLSVRARFVGVSGTNSLGFPSALSADTQSNGNAGSLFLTTERLVIQDGGQVLAPTAGAGSAGALTVNASESVEVIGISAAGDLSSSLSAQAVEGTGRGGSLTVSTRRLIVRDGGQISTSTFDAGSGGSLTVNVSDSAELIGTSADGQFPSGIFAISAGAGTGQARFSITGRGGLPPNPSETLSSVAVWVDLGASTANSRLLSAVQPMQNHPARTTENQPITEAQGWRINELGQVILTAQALTTTPRQPWQASATCQPR